MNDTCGTIELDGVTTADDVFMLDNLTTTHNKPRTLP